MVVVVAAAAAVTLATAAAAEAVGNIQSFALMRYGFPDFTWTLPAVVVVMMAATGTKETRVCPRPLRRRQLAGSPGCGLDVSPPAMVEGHHFHLQPARFER